MATSLTARVDLKVTGRFQNTEDLSLITKLALELAELANLANGTGADRVDVAYFDEAEIAAGSDLDVDLDSVLNTVFNGVSADFARIKLLFVRNQSSNAATIIGVGGGDGGNGTNAWDTWISSTAADGSEYVKVPKGGALVLFAPGATAFAVTAATGDILRFLNEDGSNAATVQFLLLGCSA